MNLYLLFHIVSGGIALVTGTGIVFLKKGNALHKLLGAIFFWSMLLVAISAFIMAVKTNNVILLVIGAFSAYMAITGRLSGKRKAKIKKEWTWYSWLSVSIIMMVVNVGLIALAIKLFAKGNLFAIVLLAFSGISTAMLSQDYRYLIKQDTKIWQPLHISRMLGTLIAAYTAFLVVNITTTVIPGFVLWLFPSIPGTALIIHYIRKVTPDKTNK